MIEKALGTGDEISDVVEQNHHVKVKPIGYADIARGTKGPVGIALAPVCALGAARKKALRLGVYADRVEGEG